MIIEKRIEHDIDPDLHVQITTLKNACFPEYKKLRSYYKQLPHFSFLAFDAAQLIGHMGIDHRVISVGDDVFTIFGIIDLCVEANYRRQGIASRMLTEVFNLGSDKHIDFLFVVANDHRLYLKNGFTSLSSYCTWLRISDHKNYGVTIEWLDELLIKQIGHKEWTQKPIDLLGYLF